MTKILHLTLKKKWFDLIATGEKKFEFREFNPYWEKRLVDQATGEGLRFDEIHFRNGYSKNAAFMRVKCGRIAFTSPHFFTPTHGEKLWPSTIAISLGPVLEVRR